MSLRLPVCHTPDRWLPPATTATHRLWRNETISGPVVVALDRTFGRFDHLDLDYYRKTMSALDFHFFVNFAGGDTLGFTEEDIEIFYPPEE